MRNRILIDLVATTKMWMRNKGAIFWTLAFPVLLIVIFGAIFSAQGSGSYNLYVQNNDAGPAGASFLDMINSTDVVKVIIVDPGVDVDQYIKDNSVSNFMAIPANFSEAFIPGTDATVYLDIRQDQTAQSAGVITSVMNAVVNHMNLNLSGGREFIMIERSPIVQENLNFIDFFVPGVIGLTAMTNCVFYMQGVQSRYYATGIFRKLSTTPFTRFEWLISRALWQIVTVLISVAVIMLVGMAFFNVHLTLTITAIAIIIVTCIMFTGLGMMISRFAKDEESANAASSAITFPMMFLSGSFFALESMPEYLKIVASVMPLTYVNNGLRDAMIYSNDELALFNLAVLSVLAVLFVAIGAYISKWTED